MRNGLVALKSGRTRGTLQSSLPRPLGGPYWSAPGRVFFVMRTIVLIDGQNLFHLARRAWATAASGPSSPYAWPSYDVEKLANALVDRIPERTLNEIRFYTGVPDRSVQRFWHAFWTSKLRHLRNRGVPGTTWVHIDKAIYDACHDPRDYRPRSR